MAVNAGIVAEPATSSGSQSNSMFELGNVGCAGAASVQRLSVWAYTTYQNHWRGPNHSHCLTTTYHANTNHYWYHIGALRFTRKATLWLQS